MTAAWVAPNLSHTAKIVLLALADNANDAGVCWPSIPKVAERCSLDQRSVYRAIAMLEGSGHVETESRPGKPTIYRVHPQPPDKESGLPLTGSHPCQPVSPDTQSQTPDSLSVPPPFPPSRALPPNPPPSVRQESSLKSRAPKRARSRTVPEDFQITEAMREWARGKAPNVDLEVETEKFRDHEFRDPHSDWPAAWRQWIRRSPEFGARARANGGKHPEDTGWRPPADKPAVRPAK